MAWAITSVAPLSHTINGRTYNTKEYRINNLAALGTTIKIGCGDAMLFTDDGGTKYKYCQLPLYNSATVSDKNPLWETNINEFSNTYSFRVQSVDGVPLRFRVFEVGIRPLDILEFSEVKGDGTKEAKRAYGYGTNKPLPGSILNPTGCNGYSWCRNFKINNTPTPKDNEAGNNLAFMIESGLAEISWNVGYVKYIEDKLVSNPSFVGSVVRAGWVMVIDVLSAKVKTISLSEVAECKPDNIEVTYDVYVGAKNKNAKNVQFHIENEATGLVLDTTVHNVNSGDNPNRMTFNSKRLGGAGNYKVRINSISDDWSTENVSSEVSGSVSLRVKPNPSLILTDTTICSGQEGRVRLMAKDHTIPFRVYAESEENGVFVHAWTQDIKKLGAKPGFGPLHWRSGSSYTDTYSYRIRIVNLENNQEQCGSNWFNYNVNVLKIPETGEQYHVPN